MKYLAFLVLILLISCSEKQKANNDNLKVSKSIEKVEENEIIENFGNLKIDSAWRILTKKNGCLTGGQYVQNGKIGGEGCIMSNSIEWKLFFKRPKDELTKFLVSRLEKRDTTRVHTCPFFLATEGELAIYALQGVHSKNWFDFKEFHIYKEIVSNPKSEIISNRDNFQGYLNDKVLTNFKEREKLKKLWLNELKK